MNNTTDENLPIHPSILAPLLFTLAGTVCFILGTSGSLLILSYFIMKTKVRTASTFMYICIRSEIRMFLSEIFFCVSS